MVGREVRECCSDQRIDDTGFAYSISEKQLDSGIISPVIEWEKELCNINPDDAINGTEPGTNKLDEACEFLNEELSSGSVSVTSIKEHAEKHGISDKTLNNPTTPTAGSFVLASTSASLLIN